MGRLGSAFFVAITGVLAFGATAAMACPPPPTPTAAQARAFAVAPGDINDLTGGDPFYYTSNLTPRPTMTDSKIPHLPAYLGFMSTNATYRFVNVNEQVLTMLGEGKHGLWRIQDNGTVREYLKAGRPGLPAGADINAAANQASIMNDYSHYIPEESFGGYKDPFTPVNSAGKLNFVDLPLTHAKYGDKYANHKPIDLPHWYCTMSGPTYPEAAAAVQFAFAQAGANQIGPLGKRAGLDVSELYTNVLRLEQFPDARAWVNVGTSTKVKWKAIDESKTKAEYYLVERPFFNVKYLFVTAVFDNKSNGDFRYVRPAGAYYDSLVARGFTKLKTEVTLAPRFSIDKGHHKGKSDSSSRSKGGDSKHKSRVAGTHLYGVHHPDRPGVYGAGGGGACPMRGGDWANYPETTGGSGWPTQYEEITPVCDGVLLDIKFFANLDGASWNDETKNLANAGVGTKKVTYNVRPGFYGVFVDPHHTSRGVTNPEATNIGPKVVLKFPAVRPPVSYVMPLATARKR
jgi:hypothetical protein